MKPKGKLKAVTLTVSVPSNWVGWLDAETRRGRYANRSELVREALRRMLGTSDERGRGTAAA